MATTWERATVVAPERLTPVDGTTVLLDSRTPYAVLPESGWGALVGWLAGGNRLVGCRDDLADHDVVLIEHRGGAPSTTRRPRLPSDQAIIDDDIDEYLADAGGEPRPTGLRWFVLLPDGVPARRFWEVVDYAAADVAPHPSALSVPVRAALDSFYDA